jgi:hypothetical protein
MPIDHMPPFPSAGSDHFADAEAWNWLLDLRQRLTPVVEVIDDRFNPVLPPLPRESAQRVLQLLGRTRHPDLVSAVQRALRSHDVETATVEDLRFALIALEGSAAQARVLLVAERKEKSGDDLTSELQRIARWLARAIDAYRTAADAEAPRHWSELAALHGLLNQAAATGSEREVVWAFAEALAVWNDIDTRGYVQDITGRFTLDVALAGADRATAPEAFDVDPLRDFTPSMRLSAADSTRFGFLGNEPVLLTRQQVSNGSVWMLAHVGTLDAGTDMRLSVFNEMLAASLRAAGELESSRLVWAAMQRLISDLPPAERAAAAARELGDAVLASVSLRVRRADGVMVLSTGDRPGEPAREAAPGTQLSFKLPTPPGVESALILRRPVGRPFTPRDERLGGAVAALLGSWLPAALQRGELSGDRRGRQPSFDQLIEQRTRRGTNGFAEISLVLIRADLADARPEDRNAWVGEIRRQLRPFDVAGTLTTGEIGVLLPDTSSTDAEVVVGRLRRFFQAERDLETLRSLPIGIASGAAGVDASLVNEARARAAVMR